MLSTSTLNPLPSPPEEHNGASTPLKPGSVAAHTPPSPSDYLRVVRIDSHSSTKLRQWPILLGSNLLEAGHDFHATTPASERAPVSLIDSTEEIELIRHSWVIEEVLLSKSVVQRTQHIRDTVRRTEVDLQTIAPDSRLSTHPAPLSQP